MRCGDIDNNNGLSRQPEARSGIATAAAIAVAISSVVSFGCDDGSGDAKRHATPQGSTAFPSSAPFETGVGAVDKIVSMALAREPFRPEAFFEGVMVGCVEASEGAPAPAEGPACSREQRPGDRLQSVQLGACGLTWSAVDPALRRSDAMQGAEPTEVFAVLTVNEDVPVLGYVGYVVYLADRRATIPTTIVLTVGANGVKQASTACGQPPERSVPTDLGRRSWLVPPKR
jgi:hypothetical protein